MPIERINVFRTALTPIWAKKQKGARGSSGAIRLKSVEELENRRTALVIAFDEVADAAGRVRRAVGNPPVALAAHPPWRSEVRVNVEAS